MKIFVVIAIAVVMLGGIVLSQLIFPRRVEGLQSDAPKIAKKESLFACNRWALSSEQRKRHFEELGPMLRSRRTAVRELADGYEFDFASDPATFQMLAEWAAGEHVCCPFFDIDLQLEREGGPVRLRLTGRNGVKQFIEVASWLKPGAPL